MRTSNWLRVVPLLLAFALPVPAGEVAIFTGTVNWMTKAVADAQAQICVDRLESAGIEYIWFADPGDEGSLADWVEATTNDGEVDVLILYGYFPPSIYPIGNGMPDGSIAELFIESTDGDAIINHGDWMFYVNLQTNNGPGGLQNMMDIPGISMAGDNNPMTVTPEGAEIAPSLTDFLSDRPFHVDELAGDWFVEASLAENEAGTRADPIIVRDGDRGRLIPLFQAADQNDPKGAVAAEIIAWLMDEVLLPTQLGFTGPATGVTGTSAKLKVSLQDGSGIPTPPDGGATTVNLASDSATGAFDTAWGGVFDGTVTSVTIPAGEASATVYYRDTAPGIATLSATAPGLAGVTDGSHELNLIEDVPAAQGEVLIYTGNVGWIDPGAAAVQAQICANKLDALGISYTWY